MPIKRVTFSGVDNTVDPKWMAEITEEYSDVINIEWGVLLSPKNDRARYPSISWIEDLERVASKKKMYLAGHLCGKYVKQYFENDFISGFPFELSMFDRIQLNIAPYIESVNPEVLAAALPKDQCYIIQVGNNIGKSLGIAWFLEKKYFNINILFDCSGGQGIEATDWPIPARNIICGYAGGLGPHNIETKLHRINEIVGNANFWIDMESGIRKEEDVFDEQKVLDVLSILRKF